MGRPLGNWHGAVQDTQRPQYPLIKEYTLSLKSYWRSYYNFKVYSLIKRYWNLSVQPSEPWLELVWVAGTGCRP